MSNGDDLGGDTVEGGVILVGDMGVDMGMDGEEAGGHGKP
jgi:hypothetical protein